LGELHATATPPSSEHATESGAPVVVQAKLAPVSVPDAGGPLVIETVGAVPEGGADEIVHACEAEVVP
jgi:hypothetical protein